MATRALRAAILLANVLLGISILAMLVGLTLSARPELFAGLWESASSRNGLAIALAGGFGAVSCAVVARLLESIAGSISNSEDDL
ncbi:MAG TPA: hypothetical protein VHS28_08140 [Chloroflexota bacterium]|nr:hypothetical protein [Chloroflexota bacterium]